MLDAEAPETARSLASVAVEFAALAVGVVIAIALSGDDRATALHKASVWMAAAAGVGPIIASVAGMRAIAALDSIIAFVMLLAIGGSYTIGGLALLGPAALFLIAGFLRFVATPKGYRTARAETGLPSLVGGLVAAGLGAFLGLSLSPLASIGWALSAFAIILLGGNFSVRRRSRRGGAILGWGQAVGIVLGLNALAWMIALSAVEIF
jgi:hypothetical protein